MTDCFALLNEPRRPWLSVEELKAKFIALSSQCHPDRVHGAPEAERMAANQRYQELNAAYNVLREPRERLLHLLELEMGGKPKDIQRIPAGTVDLFVEVGQTCREVDGFLTERAGVTSPLLKVQLFERAQGWSEKLDHLRQKINFQRDELVKELQAMNATWAGAPAIGSADRSASLPLERLEQIYRIFSYIARWTEQVQERYVQLSF
jgi:curved DNA-binding protein CbpA